MAGYGSRRSYKKPSYSRGRKLQQAVIPHNPNNALANAAMGMVANYATKYAKNVLQRTRNQSVANRNKTVASKNKSATSSYFSSKGAPELTGFKKTIGRKKPMSMKQLEKLTVAKRITRFQNLGPVDRGVDRGAHWLGTIHVVTPTITAAYAGSPNSFCKNQSDLTGVAIHYRTPYQLYCLNTTSLTDVASPSGPAFQPFIGMADGSLNFANLYGCKPDLSGGSTQWQTEYQNFGDAPSQKYIKQDWYDIRIGLRNAIQQVTTFDIWIFQFKEGYLDPLENPSSVEELKDRKAFYQSLMSAGLNHPLMNKGQNAVYNKIKFIRKMRIVMDKQQSVDSDTSPDLKTVKIFIRDGKLYDYQYASAPAGVGMVPTTYVVQNNSWIPQGAANVINAEYPKARARLWLMIRSLDSTTASIVGNGGDEVITSDDSLSVNTTPSYDIQIRKMESARI